VERQRNTLAFDTAADRRKVSRVVDGRKQLVVLSEAEIVQCRTCGERHVLELDLDPATGPACEVSGVDGETVGDVEHRMGVRSELPSLGEPEGWPDEPAAAERCARRPEGAGDDQNVAG